MASLKYNIRGLCTLCPSIFLTEETIGERIYFNMNLYIHEQN
jgi:hypothetical protein